MAISTTTAVILGFVAAGAGVTAYGQIKESQQRAETEEYNAQQRAEAEEFNADVARQQADMVEARGRLDILRQKKTAITLKGTQEALYSKSGVVLTGSPLAVIKESAANAELDILLTEFNIFTEAAGLESGALERERIARAERERGTRVAEAERKMGYIRAGKTLLTTATTLGLQFGVPKKGED